MKQSITALVSGLLFGIGLILAGMADPSKVLGFLDIAGAWDPSLALVMIGAIAVGSMAFAMAGKRNKSLLALTIHIPTAKHIDKRLVLGSLAFGSGWGLAGICPGPALVLVGTGNSKGLLFAVAMLVGMALFELIEIVRLMNNHNHVKSGRS